MHVAFGRVRRRIAQLRTSFSLMRNDYLEMVLYQINLIRSLLIKSALRGTGTSRYKWG